MQLAVGVMFPHFEEIPRQHIQKQVEGRFASHRIHLVFEYARKAPVFRGICRHLDFSGDTVRDMTDELQEFRVRILVPLVLRDKLTRHFRHIKSY